MDEKTLNTNTNTGWTEIQVPVNTIAQVLHEQARRADTQPVKYAIYNLAQQLVNRIRQTTPTLDEERFMNESGITDQFRKQAA